MYTFYDSNGKSLMTFLASSGIASLITETGSPVPVPVPITPQIQIPVSPPIQVPITDPIPPPGYIPGSSNPSGNPSNTNLGIPFLVSEPIIPIIPNNRDYSNPVYKYCDSNFNYKFNTTTQKQVLSCTKFLDF